MKQKSDSPKEATDVTSAKGCQSLDFLIKCSPQDNSHCWDFPVFRILRKAELILINKTARNLRKFQEIDALFSVHFKARANLFVVLKANTESQTWLS